MFGVARIESLDLVRPPTLSEDYILSPFVWSDGRLDRALFRVVNKSDDPAKKIARIFAGSSDDGLRWEIDERVAIAPGPGGDDRDGCEDPTVVPIDGKLYVYYSGWNQAEGRGSLLLAEGSDIARLEKRGAVFGSDATCANPKEASVVQVADGTWRLFFEFAIDGASSIGVASADDVAGPWKIGARPFGPRIDTFDSWHLSPGPIIPGDSPVMFYNGADTQARWCIGWVAFDPTFTEVVARCQEPLLVSPKTVGDDHEYAFVASAVEREDRTIDLYYSVADRYDYRAQVRRA